jgi:hypothetical protein
MSQELFRHFKQKPSLANSDALPSIGGSSQCGMAQGVKQ